MPATHTSIARALETRQRVLAYAQEFARRNGELPSNKQVAHNLGLNITTAQKHMSDLISEGRLEDEIAVRRASIPPTMRRKWEAAQREVRAAFPDRYPTASRRS